MTNITKNHYKELCLRITLFILTIISYIIELNNGATNIKKITYIVIFILFTFEMIERIIPQKKASAGNQKIFKKNFMPTNVKSIKKESKTALLVGAIWVGLNLIFAILYFYKIFNAEIMMIISMFYAVCDLICILWFCPFQKWIIKNRCCNTCRIYNWDYAMIFTPLWFVPNFYNYSLVFLSLIILVIWEITYNKFPERFHDETNDFIKCKNCKELMCKNKLRVIR